MGVVPKVDLRRDSNLDRVQADDIVITADIPLASRCLKKGVW